MAGGAIGKLNMLLGLDTTEFSSGLTKSEYSARQAMERIRRGMAADIGRVAGLWAGFAQGVTDALMQIPREALTAVKNAVDEMDAVSDRVQRLGIGAESLQELSYYAEFSSVSIEGLDTGIKTLSKNMEAAQRGTKTQAALFKALGVDVADSTGKLRGADEVMRDVADRFARMEDGANKTAIAQELFGKTGADMIVMLNGGAAGFDEAAERARDFGIVVGEDVVDAAAQFNDSMDDMQRIAKGAFNELAAAALPVLNTFIERVLSARKELGDFLGAVQGTVYDSLFGNEDPFQALSDYERQRKSIQGELDALARGDTSARAKSLLFGVDEGDLQEQLRIVDRYIASARARMDQAYKSWGVDPEGVAPTLEPVTVLGTGGGKAGSGKSKLDEGQRYIEQMQQRLALIGQETEAEKLLANIATGAITFKTEQEREFALALAASTDAVNDQMEAVEAAKKRTEQYAKLMDQLYPERAKAEDFIGQVAVLGENLNVDSPEYADALERLTKRFGETTDTLTEFAKEGARNIQGYLGDGIYDLVTGKWEGMGLKFANILARMGADLAASELGKLLLGGYGSSSSGVGGLFGSLLSGATQWLFGGQTGVALGSTAGMSGSWGPVLGGRANGGSTAANGLYEINERGWPELYRTRGRTFLATGAGGGYVTPLDTGFGASSLPRITVNNYGTPQQYETESVSRDEIRLIARDQVYEEGPRMMESQFGQANSRGSRAMGRSFNVARKR